jgi:DNA repair protein RecO (recombination protein O)
MKQRDAAICVRKADYSETSQVVAFLTRAGGLVRLIAKGAKRTKGPSLGAIDLLSEGDLVYIAGRDGLGTLAEFSESVSRAKLRTDAGRLNAALYMVELAGEMLAEADPHPEVFDLLHNGLLRLAEPDAPAPAVMAWFQWRLLRHVGLLGDLRDCVGCGEPAVAAAEAAGGSVHFSSSQGGLLCPACESAARDRYCMDSSAVAGLAILAAAAAGKSVRMGDREAGAANRLLAYHAQQQLGKKLRMAKYVT